MTDETIADTAEPVVRPFAAWLQEHRRGRLHSELSDALNALAHSVEEVGKAGELTLKLKLKPADKAPSGVTILSDELTLKLPQHDRPAALYFVDDGGNLVRNDPRQSELPGMRAVPGGVDGSTGEITGTVVAQ